MKVLEEVIVEVVTIEIADIVTESPGGNNGNINLPPTEG